METLIFKIIGFNRFENGEDQDCKAILQNGQEIRVDPFVGCAFKYENREHLLNCWWKAEGNWHEDLKNNCPKCFLPIEGKMMLQTLKT
jgi:hypothetical protein